MEWHLDLVFIFDDVWKIESCCSRAESRHSMSDI